MMITLRQIVYMGLEEALRNEELVLESELKQLTDYVLNNSRVELTDESIYMRSGNRIGIGEENKDKELILPRFMLFKFKDRDIKNETSQWRWSLQSYEDLEDLEGTLNYYDFENPKRVAIIDNEIARYESEGLGGSFGLRRGKTNWEQEVYSVSYKKENIIIEERFRSKADLEKYILELVTENTEDIVKSIKVKNLIENKKMGFSVSLEKKLYDSTNTEEDEYKWLEWNKIEEEKEEDWDWNDDFEDFDFS